MAVRFWPREEGHGVTKKDTQVAAIGNSGNLVSDSLITKIARQGDDNSMGKACLSDNYNYQKAGRRRTTACRRSFKASCPMGKPPFASSWPASGG